MNVALRNALLRGKRRPRNLGAGSPTSFRGDGLEFAELRQYVAGDDIRRIDWAATARAGLMQTRVVLEDVALTIAAVLDDSGSMRVGRARSVLAAGREALMAWYEIANADDRCARIDGSGFLSPPGMRGFSGALVCAHAAAREPVELHRAFAVAQAALPRGAALLVISDFWDLDMEEGGDVLRALPQRFDCTALYAKDPWSQGLPLGGFVTFEDAETHAQHRMFLGKRERERFAAAAAKREARVLSALSQAGWRTGVLTESDGKSALLSAFGFA